MGHTPNRYWTQVIYWEPRNIPPIIVCEKQCVTSISVTNNSKIGIRMLILFYKIDPPIHNHQHIKVIRRTESPDSLSYPFYPGSFGMQPCHRS